MRGAVIYFGRSSSCRQVASELAEALREAGHEVDLLRTDSNKALMPAYVFIALGSSTTARGLPGSVRRFVKRLEDAWRGTPFFAFETGPAKPIGLSGRHAAELINKSLIQKGLRPVAPPLKVLVKDVKGTFANGELNRAYRFGYQVGGTIDELGEKGFGTVTFIEKALKAFDPNQYQPRRRKAS